jgi:hypothetical protein
MMDVEEAWADPSGCPATECTRHVSMPEPVAFNHDSRHEDWLTYQVAEHCTLQPEHIPAHQLVAATHLADPRLCVEPASRHGREGLAGF